MKFSATATILALLALPACDGGDKTTTSDEGSTSDAATTDAATTDAPTTDTPTTTDGSTTAGGGLSFATDVWGPIIDPICSCHITGSGGLVMGADAATAFAAMVGVKSTGAPAVNYVTAGDSTASYIINKLEGTQVEAGGAGTMMPQAGTITPAQIATIKQWIDDGALP